MKRDKAVLLVNRTDSLTMPGGDTVQMNETRRAVEALGVRTEVSFDLRPVARGFDMAHVFNLQRPDETAAQVDSCRRQGVPVALSPIIWDFWRVRFHTGRRWGRLRSLLPDRLLSPFCWAVENGPMRCTRSWRLQKQALRQASVVLPNSRAEAEFVRRRFQLPASQPMRIVPNAINPAVFDHNAVPRESRLLPEALRQGDRSFVLQVGRVEPVKNQLAAIMALFKVPIPLVFVGARPAVHARYFEQCRELAARRGNVHFLDPVEHGLLPEVYRAAKVHMLPSFRETPGLVSLEAALMGCNIVTTDQGPTDEYFGPWAWYCRPSSLTSIREAVLQAMAAPFPEPLRHRILSRFTWSAAARATVAAYRWVLGDKA